MSDTIRFERYNNGHVITVPVRVGESTQTRFALDTGIGLTLLSSELCRRLGCELAGETYVGRRMSGQEVSSPLTRVPSITLGSHRQENVVAGVLDLGRLLPTGSGIEGFLAPQFFDPWPFAIDPVTQTVRIERERPTTARDRASVEVPMRVEWDGPAVALFVDLRLPSGTGVAAEVDTGSDALILDSRFMRELGVHEGRAGVTKHEGKDESGHDYTRYFARISGVVSLLSAPSIVQRDPLVMFQKIIYDGLVGDAFLRAFDVTYDLPRSRLRFSDPSR